MSMPIKHNIIFIMILALIIGLAGCGKSEQSAKSEEGRQEVKSLEVPRLVSSKRHIGVTQIATHPGIDAIRQGFLDEMAKLGYRPNENVVYDQTNANGDMATAQSIAQKFVGDGVDLIFAISTPSSQAVAKAIKGTKIPLVFGAVTDPVQAGLVTSIELPGGNITGTSDKWPVDRQIDLLLELVPSFKTLGIVYNPGESNSQANVAEVEKAVGKRGITLVTVPVSNTAEVMTAADSLVGRVDAMYVPADNTAIAAMASIVKVAEKNRIPLLPGVSSNVEQGGIGSIGPDYYDVGVQSARLADKVLKGAKAGSIPVAVAEKAELFFNTRSAATMGVKIPDTLLSRAAKVYK